MIIAYDALLACQGDWEKFCAHGVLHGGDRFQNLIPFQKIDYFLNSDSTGAIGAAWFGAVYGFEGVPSNHYEELEYKERLEVLGTQLFERAFPGFNYPTDQI